jgi:hypothetical protein
MCAFEADREGGSHNLLVGSHGGIVYVYKYVLVSSASSEPYFKAHCYYRDLQLLWASRMAHTSVDMRVGTFGGTSGMIVALGEEGYLSVSFLGTHPTSTVVSATSRDVDYEAVDQVLEARGRSDATHGLNARVLQEHRRLLKLIRERQNPTKGEPRDHLVLRVQVNKCGDTDRKAEACGHTTGSDHA